MLQLIRKLKEMTFDYLERVQSLVRVGYLGNLLVCCNMCVCVCSMQQATVALIIFTNIKLKSCVSVEYFGGRDKVIMESYTFDELRVRNR